MAVVTGRGDVKEVEICCIPARRERVHGVWSEYPLIHTNTLPAAHYTLPIPCCGTPYQYLISPDQDFSASHQYLVTRYQYLASPTTLYQYHAVEHFTNTLFHQTKTFLHPTSTFVLHTNTLPAHYTLPLPCCGAPEY